MHFVKPSHLATQINSRSPNRIGIPNDYLFQDGIVQRTQQKIIIQKQSLIPLQYYLSSTYHNNLTPPKYYSRSPSPQQLPIKKPLYYVYVFNNLRNISPNRQNIKPYTHRVIQTAIAATPQPNISNILNQLQYDPPIKIKRAFSTYSNYETPNKAESDALIRQSQKHATPEFQDKNWPILNSIALEEQMNNSLYVSNHRRKDSDDYLVELDSVKKKPIQQKITPATKKSIAVQAFESMEVKKLKENIPKLNNAQITQLLKGAVSKIKQGFMVSKQLFLVKNKVETEQSKTPQSKTTLKIKTSIQTLKTLKTMVTQTDDTPRQNNYYTQTSQSQFIDGTQRKNDCDISIPSRPTSKFLIYQSQYIAPTQPTLQTQQSNQFSNKSNRLLGRIKQPNLKHYRKINLGFLQYKKQKEYEINKSDRI